MSSPAARPALSWPALFGPSLPTRRRGEGGSTAEDGGSSREERLRARFRQARGEAAFAERFDHAAAMLFCRAEAAPLSPEQQARILRLRLRRRAALSLPLVEAYEQPDPHYGAVTLATLAEGEYGIHKIVNGADDRISAPPSALPPSPITLHLGFWVGPGGLAEPGLKPPGTGEAVRLGQESIIAALTLLVLDDWRSALRTLPVRFALHRLWPARLWSRSGPTGVELGRGGPRWSDPAAGALPPEEVVGLALERVGWADAAQGPEPARSDAARGFDWWCGVASAADLPGLGFEPTQLGRQRAGATALPAELSHLLLVPGRRGPGGIMRLERSQTHSTLVPLSGELDGDPESPDPSFLTLRRAALDRALDELEARLR